MQRFFLAVARFALAAWVGAAALFIVTAIREVRAPEINSHVRDVLVGVRFPAYYGFGFACIGLALVALFCAGRLAGAEGPRLRWPLGFILLALLVMLGDYLWVYCPLAEMVTPPGQSRPALFVTYHHASKWLNLGTVSLCAVVAFHLCWRSDSRN